MGGIKWSRKFLLLMMIKRLEILSQYIWKMGPKTKRQIMMLWMALKHWLMMLSAKSEDIDKIQA